MKTVFDNAQCAHVWAQQNQEHGRSNSMRFEGEVIYSYQTPIARIIPNDNVTGGRVVLVTSHKYSVTTSGKHMPAISRAVQHLTRFDVPNLGVHGGRLQTARGSMHQENMEAYAAEYANQMKKLARARTKADWQYAALNRVAVEARLYADTFNFHVSLDKDFFAINFPPLSEEQLKEVKANAAKVQAAKAKATRDKKKAQLAFIAENLEAWRAGISNYDMDMALRSVTKVFMRIKDGEIITSKGARFPVEHARRVWPVVLNCKNGKHDYPLPSSDPRLRRADIQLGSFRIDKIEASGNVLAGCHYVEFTEIAETAKALGLA